MRKKIKIVFIAIFFIGLCSFTIHKFYVSVTQINFVPEKKVIQITARFFIDDLNNALEKKYKKTYYQVFDGDKKIWEGEKDIKLTSCRNVLYSKLKEGEKADEVEKDFETFYFYEVNVD